MVLVHGFPMRAKVRSRAGPGANVTLPVLPAFAEKPARPVGLGQGVDRRIEAGPARISSTDRPRYTDRTLPRPACARANHDRIPATVAAHAGRF